jgi:hypothetical protein
MPAHDMEVLRMRIHAVLAFFSILGAFLGTGTQAAAQDPHLTRNPLYHQLLEKGVSLSQQHALKFLAPTMADSLDAQAQRKVIEKLAGNDYPLEELARSSVVAPHIVKFREIDTGDSERIGRGIDLWFIAHGNLDALSAQQLQTHFLANRKSNQMTPLKEADLKARGITISREADREESYVHAVGAILDRVQVGTTNRTVVSRTKDSVVLAAGLDPRFNKDTEFPNRWRPITLIENGTEKLGDAQPYEGAGMYMRMTKLHDPAGAVFVEFHQVFVEPKGWFDAPNMLRSKLPIVIQTEVRAFRRDLMKAK